jgi:hypothetical protein
VVSRRIRVVVVAAGVAVAGLGQAHAQAFEQPIEQHVDLGGAACLHLSADIAVPERPGDRTALALQQASATLGPCATR